MPEEKPKMAIQLLKPFSSLGQKVDPILGDDEEDEEETEGIGPEHDSFIAERSFEWHFLYLLAQAGKQDWSGMEKAWLAQHSKSLARPRNEEHV